VALQAVIFDLGGVVTGSPLAAIADHERVHHLPVGFVNRVVIDSGADGAWARLERGEIGLGAFYAAFERDCAAAGAHVSAAALMERVTAAAVPRPAMLAAVRRIGAAGLRTAALTNNWRTERDGTEPLRRLFHVFVESAVVGLRKPDPRIYRLVCDRLGVEPAAAVFLDDIGANLKTARALGMTTIKVVEPGAALAELERLLGFALGEA
jgi:putative hydrolase of the HAD superfamily